MCGIAGVLSKSRRNVVPQVGVMLECMINRGPDGFGLVADGQIMKHDSVSSLQSQLNQANGSNVLGHTRLAIVGGTCGAQPFTSCDGRFVLEHNGEIYNYKSLRNKIENHHKLSTLTDSEIIVHLLEDNAKNRTFLEAIKKTVEQLDGVYALAIKDVKTGEVALVRDRIGVRQLYYADAGDRVAFSSERKALWRIGIPEPTRRVFPGSAIIISPDGRLQNACVAARLPQSRRILFKTMKSAVEAYKAALLQSMEKRTQDLKRMGIIFSGGIDSVLLAHIASRMVPEVICYTGGIRGSNDTEYARKIAQRLGLQLKICEFTEQEVESLIPTVIDVIEDSNAGQVEVALPVYGAVSLARKDGIKVMISGQAADELFGGYSWYAKVAEKEGYGALRDHMVEDIMLLYKETLEREDKITMAHSIELREPYLDREVIRVALATDLHLDVEGGSDSFGKHVHRLAAQELGIPRDIAYRIKEAAQHGSGIHSAIEAIARSHGYDLEAVPMSYLEELKNREKVGSSQRYGYLYGDEKNWIVEPHVQMFLDSFSKGVQKSETLAAANSPRRAA